jgi:hypothetical protein
MKQNSTPLHAKIEQLLTEARVILPGAQALLGFQLIVMMTQAFDHLPTGVQAIHVAALLSLVIAVALYKLAGSETLSTVGALVTATILLDLWFVLPLAIRRTTRPAL